MRDPQDSDSEEPDREYSARGPKDLACFASTCRQFRAAFELWFAERRPTVSPDGTVLPPRTFCYEVAPSREDRVQEAIDACPTGGSILLLPGIHAGDIEFKREVHIFGKGLVEVKGTEPLKGWDSDGESYEEDVSNDYVISIERVQRCTLDGLTVQMKNKEGEEYELNDPNFHGAAIVKGPSSVRFQNCELSVGDTGRLSSALCVLGLASRGVTEPVLVGCRIRGGGNGVRLKGDGIRGLLLDCEISSARIGLAVIGGAAARIEGCKVLGSIDDGIFLQVSWYPRP